MQGYACGTPLGPQTQLCISSSTMSSDRPLSLLESPHIIPLSTANVEADTCPEQQGNPQSKADTWALFLVS